MSEIRVRFPPSPTGYLHIGGARTALYNWLFAKRHGGKLVLRIEDTDEERSTEESAQGIFEGLAWMGIDWDEGPYRQSEFAPDHRAAADRLVAEGKAYRCYCTKEELDELRAGQMERKEKPRYDGRCRHRTEPRPGVSPVIRFRNPTEGEVAWDDLVRGRIAFQNGELDDLIIARSDGTPTYNFTVVVDDLDMKVSHVIRGDDHVNNTPRQINILKALGAELPHYGHVPMILGADGARLSKRHGAVSVMQYRDEGYLPEALLNYLVRLGWSYGDQEIFSIDEMIEYFEATDINHSASTFNPDKLLWLNHHYLMHSDPAHVAHHLRWHLGRLDIDPTEGPDPVDVVLAQRERCKTLVEMAQASRFLYRDFDDYDPKSAQKNLTAASVPALEELRRRLAGVPAWEKEPLHAVLVSTAEDLGLKLGAVAQPLRVAVAGTAVSPPMDVTLHLLGQLRTLARIDRALQYIEAKKD